MNSTRSRAVSRIGSPDPAEYIEVIEHHSPLAPRVCADLLTRTYASLGRLKHGCGSEYAADDPNCTTHRWAGALCNGSITTLEALRAAERGRWCSAQWSLETGLETVISALNKIDPLWSTLATEITRSKRIKWTSADHWAGGMCGSGPDGVWLTVPPPTDLLGVGLLAHELGHAIHHTLQPDLPTNLVQSETVAIACERWVMRDLLNEHTDLALAGSVYAWNRARAADLLDRHSMLSRFEQALARTWRNAGALTECQISAIWLRFNSEFFGPMVQLSSSFATAWTQVQHLFLQPFTLWVYPVAWAASSRAIDPTALRRLMSSACTPPLEEVAA